MAHRLVLSANQFCADWANDLEVVAFTDAIPPMV